MAHSEPVGYALLTAPENARFCRDLYFRLSQITWRTSVAHHPTEDTQLPQCVAELSRS
jgi:hypothetical protein